MTNPEQRWHKCFGTIDGQKRTWKRQCESDTTSGDGKQPPPVGCYGNICDAPLSEWKRQQHTHYQLTSAAANRRQESKELRKRERESPQEINLQTTQSAGQNKEKWTDKQRKRTQIETESPPSFFYIQQQK